MAHRKVWESLLLHSTRNVRPVHVHLPGRDLKGRVAFQQKYEDAQDIPVSDYPDYIYFAYSDLPRKKKEGLPDIYMGQMGLVFVSGEMHDLLSQFNLGRTRFHEVELREYDQKTPYPGRRWFFMHILENRKTVVPEQSVGLELGMSGTYWTTWSTGNDKIAVDPTAAENLDFWMDKTVSHRVFFSDRLKTAIKDSGLSARWLGFRPCKVV